MGWKLHWEKVWLEREYVQALSAVAGTLTFSGWEKKQKPRDTGGGAGEKEGMQENVVTWKPTEEKT